MNLFSRKPSVTFNDSEISYRSADGQTEIIHWIDLQAIVIETTDRGPFEMDVFWLLIDHEKTLVIPQGTSGEDELLARLQQLLNFDNRAVIDAMSCTDNQKFVCWQKASPPAPLLTTR